MIKLNILAIGVHPDDVELSCSGTLLRHMALGKKAGIVDLTKGELGTRGNADLRMKEAERASEILGITVRENLGMADGFFTIDQEHLMKLVRIIRKYKPDIILCNAVKDRHPDHGRAARLVSEASFLSGLRKIKTLSDKDEDQEAWRPSALYHYIQDNWMDPNIVVDISEYMDQKMKAIRAYESQFYKEGSDEPETMISTAAFMEFIQSRAMQFGRLIKTAYGEGYTVERPIGSKDLTSLL
jgi:N-acetylglucosamine malate deacetylase 1